MSDLDVEESTCQRLIDWIKSSPRKPAHTAFTAGKVRELAFHIEIQESRAAGRMMDIICGSDAVWPWLKTFSPETIEEMRQSFLRKLSS